MLVEYVTGALWRTLRIRSLWLECVKENHGIDDSSVSRRIDIYFNLIVLPIHP